MMGDLVPAVGAVCTAAVLIVLILAGMSACAKDGERYNRLAIACLDHGGSWVHTHDSAGICLAGRP